MKYCIGLFFVMLVVVKQSNAQFVADKAIPSNLELNTNVEVVNLTITTKTDYMERNSNLLKQRKWLNSGIVHIEINAYYYSLTLPAYVQGKFCDFEDAINKGNPFRVDFSVK